MCEITTDFLSMDFDKWSSDAISVGVHLLSQESQSAFLMEKKFETQVFWPVCESGLMKGFSVQTMYFKSSSPPWGVQE